MTRAFKILRRGVNYNPGRSSHTDFDIFSAAGGDIGSAPLSGFENDSFIAGESGAGYAMQRCCNPCLMLSRFFMVAAFVNPHDIMYGDANVPR